MVPLLFRCVYLRWCCRQSQSLFVLWSVCLECIAEETVRRARAGASAWESSSCRASEQKPLAHHSSFRGPRRPLNGGASDNLLKIRVPFSWGFPSSFQDLQRHIMDHINIRLCYQSKFSFPYLHTTFERTNHTTTATQETATHRQRLEAETDRRTHLTAANTRQLKCLCVCLYSHIPSLLVWSLLLKAVCG